MEQITGVLRQRHRIAPGEPADFAVQDFTEVVHAVKSTVGLVASLLICVSLISLVVGGIGIMNIMLVTVTERYREIGLRMAVGARSRDILRQFLVEAVVLCLLGGAVGIVAGRGASSLVRLLAHWPTQPSLVASPGRRLGLAHGRRDLRLLPGVEGITTRSDRSPQIRVRSCVTSSPAEPSSWLPWGRRAPCSGLWGALAALGRFPSSRVSRLPHRRPCGSPVHDFRTICGSVLVRFRCDFLVSRECRFVFQPIISPDFARDAWPSSILAQPLLSTVPTPSHSCSPKCSRPGRTLCSVSPWQEHVFVGAAERGDRVVRS